MSAARGVAAAVKSEWQPSLKAFSAAIVVLALALSLLVDPAAVSPDGVYLPLVVAGRVSAAGPESVADPGSAAGPVSAAGPGSVAGPVSAAGLESAAGPGLAAGPGSVAAACPLCILAFRAAAPPAAPPNMWRSAGAHGGFPLAANIMHIAVVPLGSGCADIIVVAMEAAKLAVLAFDAGLGQLITLSIHNFEGGRDGPGSGALDEATAHGRAHHRGAQPHGGGPRRPLLRDAGAAEAGTGAAAAGGAAWVEGVGAGRASWRRWVAQKEGGTTLASSMDKGGATRTGVGPAPSDRHGGGGRGQAPSKSMAFIARR
ncbi:hypothetical protein JKP88DRAFT_290659 [Tribonema minus]|uniref:Uncharacterized protein n=1 Tax=Tribonema minus TaxID=303371 RepID=A0A836CFK8_9STRA|nr:hypothetical protein JKP88DRAFT_290659 [Tribonema minus]